MMGDRVLMQVVSGNEFGPAVYGHWCGSEAPQIVKALAERMKGRKWDVMYNSARLVQEMITLCPDGDTGYGIENVDHVLTAEDSQGDAGVVLIDCGSGHTCTCLGGYLHVGPDGFPCVDR